MKYIIIDLEWNGTFSGKLGHYFNEIIEIGAVMLNESFDVISEFSVLVSPRFNKKLSGRVKRLTHITNNEVSQGMDFLRAYDGFCRWVGEGDNCVMSFGTGDILVIMENLEAYGKEKALSFMKHYCDLQQLCQMEMEVESGQQLGLSAMAEKLGIEVGNMDMHRALDDSIVSAKCLRSTFKKENYEALSKIADSEFYRWLTFKTVSICDLTNPLVKSSMFMMRCPKCGVVLKRSTAVTQKSRGFIAQYFCGMCGKRFTGKHYIKLKYEGIVSRSTLTENGVSEKQEQNEDACEDA